MVMHHEITQTVAVLGANGFVGKILIAHLLDKGYTVHALARSGLSFSHPNLKYFHGDATQPADVTRVLNGTSAVFSVLGSTDTQVRRVSMQTIVETMKLVGLQRIIGLGGAGVLQVNELSRWLDMPDFPPFLKDVSTDHFKAWEYLYFSDLQFTCVCPPFITPQTSASTYRLRANYVVPQGNSIGVKHLVDFMIQELEQPEFIGQRVGIADSIDD